MKSLTPNFQWSWRMVAVGFLFLSLSIAAVHAGEAATTMPAWYPSEMMAVNLYQSGISRETSDPKSALATLLQARQASQAAIQKGGGINSAVLHNDALIGHALAIAQMNASWAAQNQATASKTNPNITSNKARPSVNHIPPVRHTSSLQLARSN